MARERLADILTKLSPESRENLQAMTPWFFNDLKFIKSAELEGRIVQYLAKAVAVGEKNFDKPFGGWNPGSAQFGVTTLRPHHVDMPTAGNNRWIWTSGSSTTLDWAAEDTWINGAADEDEVWLIYGYFELEAKKNIIDLWFQPGTQKLPIMNVQPMRVKDAPDYFIFPEPLIIEPRSPLVVKASCINVSTTSEVGLLGYFFAPASTLLEKT